jgi:phosphoglucosamine mutase
VASARFGTDGVRGVANEELTAELALALGRATARVLPAPAFVVGRDTRRSGPLLQAAFAAGLATEGADVIDLGVLPTPGVAAAAEHRGVPGAMISASHNPFGDNGIKLFSLLGTKLPVEVEAEVEKELESVLADPDRPPRRPTGYGVGQISTDPEGMARYAAHLAQTTEGRRLEGLHIVVDCANGAASEVAPQVLGELGAHVTAMADKPDGANINDHCGSTDPSPLALAVVEHQADLGLALDGDADRVIAVDQAGNVVDGDVLLALFALDLAGRGRLAGNTVVVTVMTNLGFRLAMDAHGIGVRETDVGDRHVLAALDADGLSLGGEQSGHIIFRALSTTGDGILTGIALADLMARSGRSLAELSAGLVERVPQRLVNVPIPRPERLAECSEVWDAVTAAEAELGAEGRVLLRPSGTEPLVRVMVEAKSESQADAVAAQLAGVVEAELGQMEPPGPLESPR